MKHEKTCIDCWGEYEGKRCPLCKSENARMIDLDAIERKNVSLKNEMCFY